MGNPIEAMHEGHRMIESEGDHIFMPQKGCLDCDLWIEPVRRRNDSNENEAWRNFFADMAAQGRTNGLSAKPATAQAEGE